VESAKALTATREGDMLNAAVACRAAERINLERLYRYVARGPRDGEGLVLVERKRPFRDGTTQF